MHILNTLLKTYSIIIFFESININCASDENAHLAYTRTQTVSSQDDNADPQIGSHDTKNLNQKKLTALLPHLTVETSEHEAVHVESVADTISLPVNYTVEETVFLDTLRDRKAAINLTMGIGVKLWASIGNFTVEVDFVKNASLRLKDLESKIDRDMINNPTITGSEQEMIRFIGKCKQYILNAEIYFIALTLHYKCMLYMLHIRQLHQ